MNYETGFIGKDIFKMKYLLVLLLLLHGCKTTSEFDNDELDSLFRDIATYHVDLGSSALVLASGDYIDSFEQGVEKDTYRIYLTKEKTGFIRNVMEKRCSSMDGVLHAYQEMKDVYVCENIKDRDDRIFLYEVRYGALKKQSYTGWLLVYHELHQPNAMPLYPNYSDRAAKQLEARRELEKSALERELKRTAALESLKLKSLETREEVLMKGTRICAVSLDNQVVVFTEESTGRKIKVLVGSNYFWDWPANWFACEI